MLGCQRVNRAALPHMRETGSGLLVWIGSSSVAGGVPPLLGPYFAAKAGMDALAVAYARESAPLGIETTIVVPGAYTTGTNHFANAGEPVDTICADAYTRRWPDSFAKRMRDALAAKVPDDADPQEVAIAVRRIVDAPFGHRPFRVVVDPASDGASVSYAVIDRVRSEFLPRRNSAGVRGRRSSDLTAGLAGEAVDHRQAETRALADRLGGEERLEHLADEVGRHARPGVRDADAQVLARRHVVLAGTGIVHPLVGRLDGDATAVGHGVARVDAEVQQRVLQLFRVDQRRRQARQAYHLELHGRADRPPDEVLHVLDQAVRVSGLRVEGLPPGEGREAMGQARGALGCALRNRHVAVDFGEPALRHPRLHQFQRSGDARQ